MPTFKHLTAAMAAILAVALLPAESDAKSLLGEPVVDRPSDGNDFRWCPAERYGFDGLFTADGPEVTFRFVATNLTPNLGWRHEQVDNFVVLPQSVYQQYAYPPDSALVALSPCVRAQDSLLHFTQVPPQDVILLHEFDSAVPGAWDLSGGGYYEAAASAWNSLQPPPVSNGGSLGLGLETNPDSTVTSEITVSGFEAGQNYMISLWEYVWAPSGADLKIEIYGMEFFAPASSPSIDPVPSRGIAWADWDLDGDEDAYVAHFAGVPNALYRNDGGILVDVTPAPLDEMSASTGVAWGDIDNDGDPDLYLACFGAANHLYLNNLDLGFTDETTGALADAGFGTGVSWVDYDQDGLLDLFLANAFGPNRLLKGTGTRVMNEVEVPEFADSLDTRTATWADADGDGDPDVYLVNSAGGSRLLRNDGGGAFEDVTNPALARSGWSAAWGDFDNDLDLDLFTTGPFGTDALLRNDGNMNFVQLAASGLEDSGLGVAAAWSDYDNDGDLDLFLGKRGSAANVLYRNDAGSFVPHFTSTLESVVAAGGLAFADTDGDADQDLYVSTDTWDEFFVNGIGNYGNGLVVHTVGTISNRSGIGARVTVVAGALTMMREVSGGTGRESQNSLKVHFGLGSASQADSVTVRWPSGIVQTIVNITAGQTITIVEAEGVSVVAVAPPAADFGMRSASPNPFEDRTQIAYSLPTAGRVSLRVFDVAGRQVRTLEAGRRRAGLHRAVWDGRDDAGVPVAAGIYFYELRAGNLRDTRKGVRVAP